MYKIQSNNRYVVEFNQKQMILRGQNTDFIKKCKIDYFEADKEGNLDKKKNSKKILRNFNSKKPNDNFDRSREKKCKYFDNEYYDPYFKIEHFGNEKNKIIKKNFSNEKIDLVQEIPKFNELNFPYLNK